MDRIAAGACGVSCRARADALRDHQAAIRPEGTRWVPRSPARTQGIRRAGAYQPLRRAGKAPHAGLFRSALSYSPRERHGRPSPTTAPRGPAGGRLGADLAAHVEAIVHAAEREARAAEQAIAEHRRSAEEEVRRYLAAARLHVDAEARRARRAPRDAQHRRAAPRRRARPTPSPRSRASCRPADARRRAAPAAHAVAAGGRRRRRAGAPAALPPAAPDPEPVAEPAAGRAGAAR